MFRYIGRSQMMLERVRNGAKPKTAPAILWQDNPAGGGAQRHFFIRPTERNRYHLRIIVGNTVTTDKVEAQKREVVGAARLMGIEIADSHWSEVNALAS